MKRLRSPVLRIVVLAAGFSSRLGQSKTLVGVRGVSLLRKTLLLAASLGPAELIAVVAHVSPRVSFQARGLGVSLVANRHRHKGLSSSVRCGLSKAGPWSGLLLLPVDLALLRRGEIARLISGWRGAPRRVIARRVGTHGGIPLILPRGFKPRALAITGDIGLRNFLRQLSAQQLRLVDLPSASFDVDTREDLSAARRRRGGGARQAIKHVPNCSRRMPAAPSAYRRVTDPTE